MIGIKLNSADYLALYLKVLQINSVIPLKINRILL
jgi:hypothetical protein